MGAPSDLQHAMWACMLDLTTPILGDLCIDEPRLFDLPAPCSGREGVQCHSVLPAVS